MKKVLILVGLILMIGSAAQASLYSIQGGTVEVDYWAGSGSNESIIVIDWNQTNGPYNTESHAWGYRWDGTAYVSDALDAIDAAGALDMDFGYGGGFVNDAYYNEASQGIGTDNHTSAGYTGWWALGDTMDFGATWTMNGGGVTAELLANGKIEGLNMDSGSWTLDTLTIPEAAPVPIPGAVWLLGSGLVGLTGIRRKRSK